MTSIETIVTSYYQAFNEGNREKFLSLLSENVVHEINQGPSEIGIDAFKRFMDRMENSYREQITDIEILTNADGSRAAAECIVNGVYQQTDFGLPIATGQKYTLRVGAFFECLDGRISRITNYYNMEDWLIQVHK